MLGTTAAAGAFAAPFTASIRRALAVPAHHRTGTIADVEHIVFLMQDNRSFDHYFGTLRGVRGFGGPRAVRLPNGDPVWNQSNGASALLPFRPSAPDLGLQCEPSAIRVGVYGENAHRYTVASKKAVTRGGVPWGKAAVGAMAAEARRRVTAASQHHARNRTGRRAPTRSEACTREKQQLTQLGGVQDC